MSHPRAKQFEFGPFHLNASERRLQRDGNAVALTPKAFDLLLTLLQNRGHLLTKANLMRLVWPDTFIEENNLAVHISVLRKALGENEDGVEYIRTLPRQGYCFVAAVREGVAESLPNRIRSVAVLPFEVISSEAGDDYLGLGMTDAIITRLNQISQIAVRPTSAVTRYVNREQDPLQAGRELAVEAVLSGRIARAGERIRVTVQLTDVLENTLLWADKLDNSFTDAFTYEDFISEHVARALDLKLTGDQIERLARRHTTNSAAYWAYLKGRYYWNKRSPESFKKAIQYFQYAGDKDPNYGLAYSGLADCYALLNYYGLMPSRLGIEKAKVAALKALDVTEDLAEAHASMALVKFWYDWDWPAAEIEFERSIELNPSYATAHHWYCWYLAAMGRQEESLAEGRRALEIDPLGPAINMALGKAHLLLRQFDESLRQCRRTLELDPGFIPAYYFLGQAYDQKGRPAEALAQFQTAVQLSGEFPFSRAILAYAEARAGRQPEARQTLAALLKLSKDKTAYVPPYGIALIYLGLEDKLSAIAWLEKACDEKFVWLPYLNVDPLFDSLRSEAGFKQLLKRMNFPQPAAATSDYQI